MLPSRSAAAGVDAGRCVQGYLAYKKTRFLMSEVPLWAFCGYLGSKGIYGRKVMRTPPKEIRLSIVHPLRSSSLETSPKADRA